MHVEQQSNRDQSGTSSWDHVLNVWEQQIWVPGEKLCWRYVGQGVKQHQEVLLPFQLFNTAQVEAATQGKSQNLHSQALPDSLPSALDLGILLSQTKTNLRWFGCLD